MRPGKSASRKIHREKRARRGQGGKLRRCYRIPRAVAAFASYPGKCTAVGLRKLFSSEPAARGTCRKMRNMEISKELKTDIDANQNSLKTAIRNHQVSFCTAGPLFLHVRRAVWAARTVWRETELSVRAACPSGNFRITAIVVLEKLFVIRILGSSRCSDTPSLSRRSSWRSTRPTRT